MEVRNIFCVGRNYRLHAEELGNEIPTTPLIFSKPSHALVEAKGQEILLPGDRGTLHHEIEVVIHIDKPYKKGMKAEDVIDQMALGIDFTLRDVQNELKKKGQPWLLAKGFRNSAIVTAFRPFPGVEVLKKIDFSLVKNGEQIQRGNIGDMIFDFETILQYISDHFGLDAGDMIYTGTPAGVSPVAAGDHLELRWGEETLGECKIKWI